MPKANVNGIEIEYELRGRGAPLILFNGLRRSRVVWTERFLEPLERVFRLVLLDNRGTGRSDKPKDGYTIEAFADDGAAILEAVGINKAHVFGVSMGGMIAQMFALRHPDKVRGLALGCTQCGMSEQIKPDPAIWELLRLAPDGKMDAKEVAWRQEPAYYTDAFRAANRPMIDGLFEVVNVNPTPPHAVEGHLAAVEGFDVCARLGEISQPTLIITGKEDKLIPAANSELLAQRIPGAELRLLDDAAHFFWIEKAAESAEALTRFFGPLAE